MQDQDTLGQKYEKLWIFYILQSLLAAVAVCVLVLALGKDRMITISSMGATAFIVFAAPKSIFAKKKHVIGGHLAGILAGAVFYLVPFPYYIEYPLVVGLVIWLMVVFDVEHPPAAGTALAIVTREISWDICIAVMLSAILLAFLRHVLKRHLRDLV